MKKFGFLWSLLLSTTIFSQKNFEGIITYKLQSNMPARNSLQVKLFLSDGRMKAKQTSPTMSEPEVKEWHIFNYKTGIHYVINDERKTFSIDSLDNPSIEDTKSILKPNSLTGNILGFPCKTYTIIADPEVRFSGNISTVVWYTDSLKFIIPPKYRNKRSFETLPDGNMFFLKMESYVNYNSDDNKDDIFKVKVDSFFLIADKIERTKLKDSEFLPPADYSLIAIEEMEDHDINNSDSLTISELTLTEITSEEEEEPPPPPPPIAKSNVTDMPSTNEKNFEGIITYEGSYTYDSSKFAMKVYYGKNKIKYESVEKESDVYKENSKYIITDIGKGIQYTIDTLLETIEIDSLKYRDVEDPDADFQPTSATKNILNINCRRFDAKAKIEDSVFLIPEKNWSIWFAEGIKYVIPEPFRNKRSMITLKDGNCIWLEFTISFKSPFPKNKGGTETISYKAVIIDHRSLPDSVFKLPANYTLNYKEYESISEYKIETEEKEEPPPPPPLKKTQKPSPKKDTKQKPVKG